MAIVAGWVISRLKMERHLEDWVRDMPRVRAATAIVIGSAGLLKQSVHLLFDGVPDSVDLRRVQEFLEAQPGVAGVTDLHVWAMGTTQIALTAHLLMPDGRGGDGFLAAVSHELHEHFGIEHVTLQVMQAPIGLTCGAQPREPDSHPSLSQSRSPA